MENKWIKTLALCLLCLAATHTFGQGNPGFIGKKISIGYSKPYCLMKSLYLLDPGENTILKALTNNEFFAEYATSKYRSVSLVVTTQKLAVENKESLSGQEIGQQMVISGKMQEVRFSKVGGYGEFAMFGVGLKYNFYQPLKTIASPIGLAHYLRMDLYSNRSLKNHYTYSAEYDGYLNDYELAYAEKNIKTKALGNSVKSFSMGYGVESKFPVTRMVYLRLNGEFNVNFSSLKDVFGTDSYDDTAITVNEDLDKESLRLTAFRNLFQIGMGVGVLL